MYHALKGFFLLLTFPIWVFPYAYSQYKRHQRPKVKVVVRNYHR